MSATNVKCGAQDCPDCGRPVDQNLAEWCGQDPCHARAALQNKTARSRTGRPKDSPCPSGLHRIDENFMADK